MKLARPILTLAAAAAISAAPFPACGGGSDEADEPSKTAASPSIPGYAPEFQQFARCVSEQGLDPPPPPAHWMAPGGPDPDMLRAAAQCRRYLPPYGQQLLDQALRER
jgi:hypothetical protein